jgi:hypothetical protein
LTNAVAFNVSKFTITVKRFVIDPTMSKAKSNVDTKSEGAHKYEGCNVLNDP